MKKTILSTLIITSAIAIPLAGINTSPQKADAISKYETYCNSQNLAKLGEIRRTDVIIINGQENPLYCTFSNKDEAIKNLKSLAPNILSYLQAEFKLGPINSENWKEYQTGFISLSATNEILNSVNSGWWHKRNGSSHTHSVSWIRANAFARYMGVGFGTFVHRTFADSIAVGDFITYDDEYDGEWGHMGFVTAQASAEANHNGNTYRDYKVAQHTLEYNSWTSEDRNGWENVKKPGKTARYGRVRR